MMRTATIKVEYNGKTLERSFPIKDNVEEYEIADYAFQVSFNFLQNCVIMEQGYKASDNELSKLLFNLNYSYTIKGEF